MSARFPFPTKLNPLWWIKNSDDAVPPADYRPGQPQWYRIFRWYLRNPGHNLQWYVVGCADRPFLLVGKNTNWNEPQGWHFHALLQKWPPFFCPYVSYKSPKFEFYLGWRANGPIGARPTWR